MDEWNRDNFVEAGVLTDCLLLGQIPRTLSLQSARGHCHLASLMYDKIVFYYVSQFQICILYYDTEILSM